MYMYVRMSILQDNPDVEFDGWMKLSGTPDLNFLSQIVLLLFENEVEPPDSPKKYYIDLHISAGVKSREYLLTNSCPDQIIEAETSSPSFVKRLPTVAPKTTESTASQSTSPKFRKVSSYPLLHSLAEPISVSNKANDSTANGSDSSSSPKSLPDNPENCRKFSLGLDQSLQTLGEPGIVYSTGIYIIIICMYMTYVHVATCIQYRYICSYVCV